VKDQIKLPLSQFQHSNTPLLHYSLNPVTYVLFGTGRAKCTGLKRK
jgi:hypothetical protein